MKGKRVKVVKGRKAKGVEGTVFWHGKNKYGDGMRVGIKSDDGETHWVDVTHVEELEDGTEAAEEAATAEQAETTESLPPKGTRVAWDDEHGTSCGEVFWTGQNKYGPGMRLGVKDEAGETHWIDAATARVATAADEKADDEPAVARVAKLSKADAPSLDEVFDRVPQPLRTECQIDRILYEARGSDGERFELDLGTGLWPGDQFFNVYSLPVPTDALVAMDEHVGDIPIDRIDLSAGELRNAGFIRLLATNWMVGATSLDITDNRLTTKGFKALFASDVMPSVRRLRLGNDKVGTALAELRSEILEEAHLGHCGLSGKALAALGARGIPAFSALTLHASSIHATQKMLTNEFKHEGTGTYGSYSADEWATFCAGPVANQLRTLWLSSFRLAPDEVEAIASASLPALQTLVMTQSKLGCDGVHALAGASGLDAITQLSLADAGIEGEVPAAMSALAESRFAGRLTSLNVSHNRLETEGFEALASGGLRALERLVLAACGIGDAGCAALAAHDLPLTVLRLSGNRLTTAGLEPLLASPIASRLTELDLSHNAFGDDGCEAVLSSSALQSLDRLALSNTGATDALADALEPGQLPKLTKLQIHGNPLTDGAKSALRQVLEGVDIEFDAPRTTRLRF